jgi:hypothetical protein
MKKKIWILFLFLAVYDVSFSQSKMEWVRPIIDGSQVLFTGKEFVGLSYESTIASPDGVVWTRHSTERLESMAYGLGGFVAFNQVDNESMSFSPDGRDWKRLESVPYKVLSGLTDIVFGNNVFVAVTASGKIFFSSDRLNWGVVYNVGDSDSIPGARLESVTWGGGLFVAVGLDARSVVTATSPDGTRWTFERNVPAIDLKSVAYGNGKFVAADR